MTTTIRRVDYLTLYIHFFKESVWKWRGFSIRYQCCGDISPALVLIHGFGANSDHWRKNIGALGKLHRVYAIDLIGYGYSDKPNPRGFGNTFYTFETWASQLNDFCLEIVKDKAFFICNSIGGLVGLQAAIMDPQICRGLLLLNISLRMLHIKKQPPLGRPLIKSFQSILRLHDRDSFLGKFFFETVATAQSVRNILCQCSVLIAWDDYDPWEPIELGRAFGNFGSVEDFVVLPDVGHCPQMARDVLVIPVSTVTSEFALSTGGQVLESFHNSLTPRMLRLLYVHKIGFRLLIPHYRKGLT